jgi:two-component system response regulator GlrR
VTAVASAEEALARLELARPRLVLSDVRLPGMDGLKLYDAIQARYPGLPVILLTAHGTIPDAVDATMRGVFSYLTKPFDGQELMAAVDRALAVSAAATPHQRGGRGLARRDRQPLGGDGRGAGRGAAGGRGRCLGADPRRKRQRQGAAGQRHPPRQPARQGPFVAVNCSAIPEALLESELFGHVKGAFTGAVANHRGLFQSADGGTLFLDEIGDMPPALQVKLLRVLQERQVRPVGAQQSVPVDVRILSATHRDLDAAMAAGEFREDLYYRLNVVTLTLPSLAERREDIPLLAQHFLQRLAAKYQKRLNGFAPDALSALSTAAWPGNVRQLHNVVEQVCALATAPLIPLSLVQRALRVPTVEVLPFAEAKRRFEHDYLVGLLKLTDGQVADAARLAERNRTEFYRLLQKHGLTPGLFRGESPDGDEGGAPVADERQDK